MLLNNKVAVITGGASGIGRATALKYTNEGAKVVVADYNEEGANETVELIRSFGGEAVTYKVDVSKFGEVKALVDFAVDTYKTIDIMFNNAGISRANLINELNEELYHQTLGVNQHGVAYGIAAASNKMIGLGVKGVIINTASVYGIMASRGFFPYHVSKGAVVMMTKSAALDLAPYGIRVIGVAPGFVSTPLIKGIREVEQHKNYHMRKEFITPEEIADTVCILAMKEANVVNGSVVMLDDGLTSFKGHLSK
ncbi:SDR family NAD(P)-dependent oxidoreductase [Neobacillus sp. NRS-1170]|uniref:SDR family NAD(P)-dependent oxidoreductase n=1 Tax=Neobacillus sp. NRS-1170 TaxID=3233898 RepID=UPI003D2CA4BF